MIKALHILGCILVAPIILFAIGCILGAIAMPLYLAIESGNTSVIVFYVILYMAGLGITIFCYLDYLKRVK